jgi:hypothetical protein
MTARITVLGTAFALMLITGSLAFAQQQGGKSDMSGMQGMSGGSGSPGQDMPAMDMQSMMNQCAQMRQQMKPGAAVSPEMKKMMSQCDEMDRSMNASSQPYTPPQQRKR